MLRNSFFVVFLLFVLYPAQAILINEFTPIEHQQIHVATPRLFEKSKSFSVDFSLLKSDEWSFPLPVGKVRRLLSHKWIDIYSVPGDAVKAMFAGKVRMSRYNSSYGNVVVVRHGNGLETVYSHNAQNLVKVGDVVKAGQTLAIIGKDPSCPDSAFCRFEMMVNGCSINPETLLKVHSHQLRRYTFLFTDKGRSVDVCMMESEQPENVYPYSDSPLIELDGEFTSFEQRHVSAQTNGLFKERNSITIDFSKYGKEHWSFPLAGAKMISPYGGKRRHSGVDLKTKPNDNVLAVLDGKVRYAGRYAAYGNVVVIRHACGIETVYSHNSKNLVKAGDWVRAGQVIALTGRTGRATTEHVHFEVRINGKHYNPTLFFDCKELKLKPVKVIVYKSGRLKKLETA